MVQRQVGAHVRLRIQPTNDPRSYHVCADKIKRELGFETTHSIEQAVEDLVAAFKDGRLPDSLEDPRYFNIKMMQRAQLR